MLNLAPENSAKKNKSRHVRTKSPNFKPFNIYSSYRHPNDPFPDIRESKKRHRSRKNKSRSKKFLKFRKESHHKSSSKFFEYVGLKSG